jgi:glycerate 2-kinase
MIKVVIAPNAFKHSLDAFSIAQAIGEGLTASGLSLEAVLCPIADGGNGTAKVLSQYFKAHPVEVSVENPLGEVILATYYLTVDQKVAIIELANASGIHLIDEQQRNPMMASTFGTGQLIEHALQSGAEEILIGLGGSATVDAGVGLLQALGVKFLDKNGVSVGMGGETLGYIHSIQGLDNLRRFSKAKISVICDVDNPLVGTKGAAVVFGPQKGADAGMVKLLESHILHFANVVEDTVGKNVRTIKHGGAAGGTAAALFAFLDAKLVDGSGFVLDLMDLKNKVANADIVITAEGRLDEQTVYGKGPSAVARLAKSAGVPVIMLAGEVKTPLHPKVKDCFDAIFAISQGPQSLQVALEMTQESVVTTSCEIGRLIKAVKSLVK